MKIKTDWENYKHSLRSKEFELAFENYSSKQFEKGLELGAGDGFQSHLLSKYVSNLVCSEYSSDRLPKKQSSNINYKICDAEISDAFFPEKYFDIVFSSHLLEHLPNSVRALNGIYRVLKDNGITIHVIPNSFWQLCHIMFHYPNMIIDVFQMLFTSDRLRQFLKRTFDRQRNRIKKDIHGRNNPKFSQHHERSKFSDIIRWPVPHGASQNNFVEFVALSRKRWLKDFSEAGFEIVDIKKGPVNSGHGFGVDFIRSFLEKLGFCSSYIFICKKK